MVSRCTRQNHSRTVYRFRNGWGLMQRIVRFLRMLVQSVEVSIYLRPKRIDFWIWIPIPEKIWSRQVLSCCSFIACGPKLHVDLIERPQRLEPFKSTHFSAKDYNPKTGIVPTKDECCLHYKSALKGPEKLESFFWGCGALLISYGDPFHKTGVGVGWWGGVIR